MICAFRYIELSAFPYRLTRNTCQLIFIDAIQVARSFRGFRCLLCLQLVERGVLLFAFGFPLKFLSSKRRPLTLQINPLTPNDPYRGRNAPLTSKLCILYIYSANIGTEYFKHGMYSPFISLQNAVCFIILTYLVPVLFTFYIQGVLKLKKIIPAPKG